MRKKRFLVREQQVMAKAVVDAGSLLQAKRGKIRAHGLS